MYHQMPVSLKFSWTMDKWKQQLENFLKLKDEEQSKKQVHAFMLKIYEESWNSLERSKP